MLRVKVDIKQRHLPNHVGQYHFAGDVVDFSARNVGALEVRVTQCGLAHANRRWFRPIITKRLALPIPSGPLRFPYDIPAGQGASFQADVPSWCKNPPAEGWRHYRYVYFEDALGYHHKARVANRFFDELERLCAAATTAQP